MASKRKLARIKVTDPRADGWEPQPGTKTAYQAVRAGAINRQPEQLRRSYEARRAAKAQPPAETGHTVILGKTGEAFPVKPGTEPAAPDLRPARHKAPPDERWCSVCNRFLTAAELRQKLKDGEHKHGPKPRRKPRARGRRKQNWRWQGMAGPDVSRAVARGERVDKGRGERGEVR